MFRHRRIILLVLSLIMLLGVIPFTANAEGRIEIIDGNDPYYYYYINDTRFDEVDLYSKNNRDSNAYWRPKYDELLFPMQEYIEFNNKRIKIDTNGFDLEWSEVNKLQVPTSRALEILGYDFLLFEEQVDKATGEVTRIPGYQMPITAPYFIMNIYKALGIELYDVYYDFNDGDAGVFVTRTNPNRYWELFLNDHPIDYSIYNDQDVTDITKGQIITTEDAISILAQMLDFYGEPVISKQEEYLLLQVYGNDVPTSLSNRQKDDWSYLKSRGVIGEKELEYNKELTFEDMTELLMRSKDTNSRTNFKEIQITTNLDNSFISNGYYERETKLVNQPHLSPIDANIDWNTTDRYDFLIEVNNDIVFRFPDSGELNKDIFISKGPLHNDKDIPGSVFEGIKDGRFYHFSVPKSELTGTSMVYVNSSKANDIPLNYHIPISSRIGGVYSTYEDQEGSIVFGPSIGFDETFPNSLYIDSTRSSTNIGKGKQRIANAASDPIVTLRYSIELLDVEESIKVIKALGGEATQNGEELTIRIRTSKVGNEGIGNIANIVSRKLIISDEYKYTSSSTNSILGLTNDRLLVNLSEAKNIKLVNGYKHIPDKDTLIIYTKDNDVVIVDNKYKTIQKGNTYLQIREEQDLIAFNNGDMLVDFRALYGTKEIGFNIGTDVNTGDTIVNMYSNSISKDGNKVNKLSSDSGEYMYYMTAQMTPYTDTEDKMIGNMGVNLLYKFNGGNSTVASEISEVVLPFSSSNPMGNYILYGEFDKDYGIESYYIVTATPKKLVSQINPNNDGMKYNKIFRYYPDKLVDSAYAINVVKLSTDNKYNIKNIPGVGWSQVLSQVQSNNDSKLQFLNSYLNKNVLIPQAYRIDGNIPRLYNYNINYTTDELVKGLTSLDGVVSLNSPVPAAVGMQSWFTDPILTPTISLSTIKEKTTQNAVPEMYWGTMGLEMKNNKLTIKDSSISIEGYSKELSITGMNRVKSYLNNDSYKSPGIYKVTSENLNATLSTEKDEISDTKVSRRELDLEKFFKQFEDITFQDFIYGLDNSMSIAYYIITRVVPLIILSLLVFIMIITSVSDMRIVQLFCDKVFDPVSVLTLGNYNIHTVRSKFLVFSLIGALTLMGIIQAGNLEKIIMFFIRFYYAFRMLFN